MDDGESDLLDQLAAEIADGGPIDWDTIGRLPSDDRRRRLFEHLRVVAAIAEQHRSAVDDAADEVATVWGPDQAGRIGFVRPAAHHAGAEADSVGHGEICSSGARSARARSERCSTPTICGSIIRSRSSS